MSKKKKKKKKEIRSYDSKKLHEIKVKERLEEIKKIQPKEKEPIENLDKINTFFRERKKDKLWNERRRLKDE